MFFNHYLTGLAIVDGNTGIVKFYDPSYGTGPFEATGPITEPAQMAAPLQSVVKQWENASTEGFTKYFDVFANGRLVGAVERAKRNNSDKNETSAVPIG